MDRTTGLPAIRAGGETRILGCLPARPEDQNKFATFNRTIPRSEWRPKSLSYLVRKMRNQRNQSSCVGHGSVLALEAMRILGGQSPVALSPCFTYGNINRGKDEGAYVVDALKSHIETGCCLEEEVGPGQIDARSFPKSAFETAKRFRLVKEETYRLQSFDDIISANLQGEAVVFGIYISDNISNLDDEGISPPPDMRGGGGHCMPALGVYYSQRKKRFFLEVPNSWGTNWGFTNGDFGGWCRLGEEYFENRGMKTEAYAIKYADVTDPEEQLPPDPVMEY